MFYTLKDKAADNWAAQVGSLVDSLTPDRIRDV